MLPSVLNETINTAQETINNAQQTIQTAQKRITDNLNAAPSPSPSPPYLVGSYTPPSPPFNPNAATPDSPSPDFQTQYQENQQDLEQQNTIIKKEGSETEKEKTDEDTADKSVEKAGEGEIMIDALPTLTNIFNKITKSD